MEHSNWPESVAVMVVAVAVASIFFPYERFSLLPWEALSAIGTVAAAAIAVFFGLLSVFRDRVIERRISLIAAAGYVIRMRHTAAALKVVADKAEEAAQIDMGPDLLEILSKTLDTSRIPHDQGFVQEVGRCLTESQAIALATSVGMLDSVRRKMDLGAYLFTPSTPANRRMEHMASIAADARASRVILVQIDKALAAKLSASLPSGKTITPIS